MRSIQPQRRRSSAGFFIGLLLLLSTVTGGVLGVLWLAGVDLNPWSAPADDPFMVRIPINSQAIPAYTRVGREHLLNPQTGGLMYQRVPPKAAIGLSLSGVSTDQTPVNGRIDDVLNQDDQVVFLVGGKTVPQSQVAELGGALMNINAILGRVVRKDKRAGLGFQESNFFPDGTPEGIAGATPPGMKAVTLDATMLTGIHSLNSGDRLDLIASAPVSGPAPGPADSGGPLPGPLLGGSSGTQDSSYTEPVLLAENALLLRPVTVRNESTMTSSLTSGKRLVNEPKYEVTIAVTPDDVIPLQSALDRELVITCVASSMQPAEELADESTRETGGTLLVPVTVRPIPAYAVVTRDAFVSPATRRLRREPVSERQLQELLVGDTDRRNPWFRGSARHSCRQLCQKNGSPASSTFGGAAGGR